MPANRSRTDRWREVLHQIHERNGGLELTVDQSADDGERRPDVIFRVRILEIRDDCLILEQPAAVGRGMRFAIGTPLVCVMSVGQNRWMFKATILSEAHGQQRTIKITMPTDVERCMRRNFYRVSTAAIRMLEVQVYPLRDIASAVAAEVANAAYIRGCMNSSSSAPVEGGVSLQLPDVGTPFTAKLMNVGGGGVGLIIGKADASALEQARVFWLRLDLRPHIPGIMGLTARLAHTHIDSEQNTYAGMAFEFAHHPQHREFVVQQFTRYVDAVQQQFKPVRAA